MNVERAIEAATPHVETAANFLVLPGTIGALAAVTSDDDDGNQALQCVLIEPKGDRVLCVATNGFSLVVADLLSLSAGDFPSVPGFDPTVLPERFVVPAHFLKSCCAGLPKRSTIPVLTSLALGVDGEGRFVAASTDLETPRITRTVQPECKFPDYNKVMIDEAEPGKPNGDRVGGWIANPMLLGVAVKAAAQVCGVQNIKRFGAQWSAPVANKDGSPGACRLDIEGGMGKASVFVMGMYAG